MDKRNDPAAEHQPPAPENPEEQALRDLLRQCRALSHALQDLRRESEQLLNTCKTRHQKLESVISKYRLIKHASGKTLPYRPYS